MKSIVQSVANAISGVTRADLHVYNEVIVRAVLHSIYRGASPKYTVKTIRKLGNTLYSHKVETPGLFTPIPAMREHYAAVTLKKRMYDSAGNNVLLDSVCRYIISICAFLPEHADDMIRSIASITRGCEFLDVVQHIATRMQELFQNRIATSPSLWINWGKLHAIYYDRLYEKASNTMSEDSIAMVAYAIFSGRACSELTKLRDELQGILSESSAIGAESAPDVLMKLALLANFSTGLSKDFRVHVSRAVMNLRGKAPSISMLIRPRSILKSLSDALPHNVQDAVNDTIRDTCLVNAEMLLLSSMLFDNRIAISADKIGGLALDSGDWIYCFSTKFSFPLLGDVSKNDFEGDFLGSKTARDLVDLLIESHHLRERCSFPVSYSKLAEEVRDLDCRMEEGGLDELMLQDMCEALFEVEPSEVEIYGKLRTLVDLFRDRIRFLRAFVDSPDYKHLADFLSQSNAVDSYADFANYLTKKRRLAKEVADSLVIERKRRKYKFISAVGEVTSVLVIIAGMSVVLSSFYYIYTKEHDGASFALLSKVFSVQYVESHAHVLLIAGIVVSTLGFLLLAISWISSTSLYKKHAGAAGELSVSNAAGNKEIKCKFDKREYLLSLPYASVDLISVGFVPGHNAAVRRGTSVMELELGWKAAAPLIPLAYREKPIGDSIEYTRTGAGFPEVGLNRRVMAISHGADQRRAIGSGHLSKAISYTPSGADSHALSSNNQAIVEWKKGQHRNAEPRHSHIEDDSTMLCSNELAKRREMREESRQQRIKMQKELAIAAKEMVHARRNRKQEKSSEEREPEGMLLGSKHKSMDQRLSDGFKNIMERCTKHRTSEEYGEMLDDNTVEQVNSRKALDKGS